MNRLRQDPDFMHSMTEGNRAMLRERWQDPEFRAQIAEAARIELQERCRRDPEFRQRLIESSRQARLDPANLGRYVLPTIYGERWDVGFAQSSWEANLARVISYSEREFLVHEPLRLADGSLFELDFLTLDNRERWVGYEIMAYPLEVLRDGKNLKEPS